jgi:hypothetical protein
MQAAYVTLSQTEKALALVPVYRKIKDKNPFTDKDLQALLAAATAGLLNPNYMPDWVTERQARLRLARMIIDQKTDRNETGWLTLAPEGETQPPAFPPVITG